MLAAVRVVGVMMLRAFGSRNLRHAACLGAKGSRKNSDHEYRCSEPAQTKHVNILRRERGRVNREVTKGRSSFADHVIPHQALVFMFQVVAVIHE